MLSNMALGCDNGVGPLGQLIGHCVKWDAGLHGTLV